MNVLHPRLWSVDEPNMYRAQITIKSHGKLVDSYTQPFGIRTISFSATRGFLLNGKPLPLKGGCIHHDNGFLRAAAIDRAEYRRVEMMKANGYNAIRCSHNPPSETFLNACDELGIPWSMNSPICGNCTRTPTTIPASSISGGRATSRVWCSDRNHPSIIMWSIGNEIPKADIAQGVKIGTMLRDKVRQLDGTRAVTEAVPSFLIHGGWKTPRLFRPARCVRIQLYARQIRVRPSALSRPRDVCFWIVPRSGLRPLEGGENHPYVIGDFVWTAMDYIGEVSVASSKYASRLTRATCRRVTG